MTEVTNARKRVIKTHDMTYLNHFHSIKTSNKLSDLDYFLLTILNSVCMESTYKLVVEVNYLNCCCTN